MSRNLSSSILRRNFNLVNKQKFSVSAATNKFITLEAEKSAHNYHPIPKVLSRGKGVYVWDVDGKVGLSSIVFFHLFIVSEILGFLGCVFSCESGTLSS